jgi:hypothetical protein
MAHHSYTTPQIDWLRRNRALMTEPVLVTTFNAQFGTDLSVSALRGTCKRHGFRAASNGRFVAGGASWNANVKGYRASPATEFKKGNTPKNILPVGTELEKDDGYVWVKIAEPSDWWQKHRLIWEAKNGPQPKDTAVIFLDGDRRNFAEDNLQLLTRRELLQLNRNKYSQAHPELKPAVLAVSKLETAVFAAQNRGRTNNL